MSKTLPKIIRCDAILFRLGTTARRVRKDRDVWELVDEPSDAVSLYYEDIRPGGVK